MRIGLLGLSCFLFVSVAVAAEPFELQDGDRVVWLGGTFIEREGNYGYLESALTARYPDRNITFRNLGWSGDTVWAESRGIFDPPEVGYKRMIERIQGLKPTVIVLAYGANESFAGEKGLPAFTDQYEKLLLDLKPTGARFVFVTPHRFEALAAERNRDLARYAEAIRAIADRWHSPFVDLFAASENWDTDAEPYTDNGIHLTESGYRRVAAEFETRLLGSRGDVPRLEPDQRERLRAKIIEKNRLYFYQWRPQNVTYLTGFRKHEQGQNAAELPLFDPLIADAEAEIAKLRSTTAK